MSFCNLCNSEQLLNQYKEVSQILLRQSLLLEHVDYHRLTPEEVEELEVQEKGINIHRYREYVSDILLKTFLVL